MANVPPEVKAIIGNYSNEAKLALLERRFTIPPSPAVSRDDTRGTSLLNQQNSVHSCQSARVQPTEQNTPTAASGRSKHTLDAGDSQDGVNQPSKRRRVQQQLMLSAGMAQQQVLQPQQQQQQLPPGPKRGASPPSMGQLPRPSLSPFLTVPEGQKQSGKLTPSSKQKQRNSISRYFPTMNGGGISDSAGAAATAGAPGKPAASSPPYHVAVAQPVAVVDPALQEEARMLR
jgi:hypothetical protein